MKQWLIILEDGSKKVITDEELEAKLKEAGVYVIGVADGVPVRATKNKIYFDGLELVSAVREDCDRVVFKPETPKKYVN